MDLNAHVIRVEEAPALVITKNSRIDINYSAAIRFVNEGTVNAKINGELLKPGQTIETTVGGVMAAYNADTKQFELFYTVNVTHYECVFDDSQLNLPNLKPLVYCARIIYPDIRTKYNH